MAQWKRSNLQPGDTVKLPESVFITDGKRLLSSRYIGETVAGLLIELTFLPPILSEEVNRFCVDW